MKTRYAGNTNMYNILPIDDLIEHIESPWCWCKPKVTVDNIVIHNSADGREYFEEDNELFSDDFDNARSVTDVETTQ